MDGNLDRVSKEKYLLNLNLGRRDEIGRRARLKIWWGQPRVGSSPTAGNLTYYNVSS